MIETGIGLYISLIVIVASITDIRSRVIPHKLMYPALVIGLILRIFHHELPLLNSIIAFLVIGGLLFVLALINTEGMGGGDITLGAFVGLMLGLPWSVVAIIIGIILGLIFGLVKMLQLKTLKIGIPLGPFIAIGTLFSFWSAPAVMSFLESLYF
jgi:prepilin signal peptidase PulO-like enzyme (type II secretory pathway)